MSSSDEASPYPKTKEQRRVERGEREPAKKKKIITVPKEKVDVSDLMRRLKEKEEENKAMLKELKLLQEDIKGKQEEVERDESKLKDVTFRAGRGYFLLQQLGALNHPMAEELGETMMVHVGSMPWLMTLDRLRAYGWPVESIDKFLNDSADIVLRDMNHEVRMNGVNHIEEFCNWFPDSSKRRMRLKNGIDELLEDIRQAFAPENPFSARMEPSKVKGGKDTPVAPPRKISIRIDNIVMEDFLRNWTNVTEKVESILQGRKVYECIPPGGYYNTSWIPVEYRKKVEEAYNLTPFFFESPKTIKEMQISLQEGIQTLRSGRRTPSSYFVERDAFGKFHLTIQAEDPFTKKVGGYRVYLEKLQPHDPESYTISKGDQTLRQITNSHPEIRTYYYPLLYLLLNVEPKQSMEVFAKNPTWWANLTYQAEFKGVMRPRLYAHAPFYIFRELLIRKFGGPVAEGDTPAECLTRFIENAYAMMRYKKIQINWEDPEIRKSNPDHYKKNYILLPKEPPAEYIKWLTDIFTLGDKEVCPEFLKPKRPVATITNGSNGNKIVVPQVKTYTKQQMYKLPSGVKRDLFKNLKAQAGFSF